ncbi:hypothetical protein AAMO2058_000386300 [Amorphochlora amoebiformis]
MASAVACEEDTPLIANRLFDGKPPTEGAVGLTNLGNTCFINSVVQCLKQVPEFRNFFTSGRYESSINRKNELGTQGRFAYAFSRLFKSMYNGKNRVVAPREVIHETIRRQPDFGGGAQHDASEFLSFLLDTLHEDLKSEYSKKPKNIDNTRISSPKSSQDSKKGGENSRKKQVSRKRGRKEGCFECGGRVTDGVCIICGAESSKAKKAKRPKINPGDGDEEWQNYLKNNSSVIVALFQGQLRSLVKCTACGQDSTTFEPFLQLSLPIPRPSSPEGSGTGMRKRLFNFSVTAVAAGDNKKTVNVFVGKTGRIKDLGVEIAKKEGWLRSASVLIAYSQSHVIRKIFPSSYSLRKIPEFQRKNLTAFLKPSKDHISVQVLHLNNKSDSEGTLFGEPCMAFFNDIRQVRNVDVWKAALESLNPFLGNKEGYKQDFRPEKIVLFNRNLQVFAEVPKKVSPCVLNLSREFFVIGCVWSLEASREYWDFKAEDDVVSVDNNDEEVNDSQLSSLYGLEDSNEKLPSNLDAPDPSDDSDPEYVPDSPTIESPESSTQPVTLRDCLSLYFKDEVLGRSEAYECRSCKKRIRATKGMRIWRLPKVLIVHLNRFRQLARSGQKVTEMVKFPMDLSVKEWTRDISENKTGIDNDERYDLFAVLNHTGGLHSGHYTAMVRHKIGDNYGWFQFNDAKVSKLTHKAQLVNKDAYILCYLRREPKAVKTKPEKITPIKPRPRVHTDDADETVEAETPNSS